MNNIVIRKYKKKDVYVNLKIDKLRNTENLCVNCRRVGYCQWASEFYEKCKATGLAIIITRCPIFMNEK